jgi:ADP-ribose pyrophosphatase
MIRQLYRGRIVDLRLERVTLPNGTVVDLELMHHPGASAVAAVDDAEQVVLIRQYRHAAGGYIWELPAGVLDGAEAPVACAARELREEVGLVAQELRPLGSMLTTPGFCDERIHLFLARGLHDEGTAHEPDEVISEIRRVPLVEALGMIRTGEIVDGKTIAGLHLAAAAVGGAA